MYIKLLIKQIKKNIDICESSNNSNKHLNEFIEKEFVNFEKVLSYLFDDTYKNEWRSSLYKNVYGNTYTRLNVNVGKERETAQEYYLMMYNDIIDNYVNKKEYSDAINNFEVSISDNNYLISIPTVGTLKTILDNGNDIIIFSDRRFDIEFKVSKRFLNDLALKFKTLTFYYNKDGTLSYVDNKTYKTITVKNEVF